MEYKGFPSVAHWLVAWFGNLKEDELTFLKLCVKQYLPAKKRFDDIIVVDIGAGSGTSTIAMLETREDLMVFSVDRETNKDEAITNEHLRLQETGLDKTGRVVRIWGDSKYVGLRFPIQPDILFVDGDHRTAGVVADIETWHNAVVKGGLIFFHDYDSELWGEVKAVVDRYEEWGCSKRVDVVNHLICFEKISDLIINPYPDVASTGDQ